MSGIATSRPDLRRYARAQPLALGSFHRRAALAWLGPYTPDWVPDYIRKRMRRDPQIQLGLTAVRAPFHGITYRVEGGRPRVRAFLQRVLIEAQWFKRVLSSVLNALDFGRQGHELVWALRDVDADPDGEGPAAPERFVRAYVLDRVVDLDPERTEVLADVEFGDFAGLRVEGARVPASKCMLATYRPEWGSLLGTAIVDAAYNPWYWANANYVFANRHLELKGDPPYLAEAPAHPSPDPSRPLADQVDQDDEIKYMGQILAHLRGSGQCVIPSDRDPVSGQPLYAVRELQVANRADLFLAMAQHYQDLKLRALLVPERIVTQESTIGSFAMQQGMLDVFFSNLEVILEDLVLTTLNQGLVRPLVEANFGRSEPLPRLTASEMSRVNRELLAQLVVATINEPRRLPDGRTYTGGGILDLVKALRDLNVPMRDPAEIATLPVPAAGEIATPGRLAPPEPMPSPLELATHPASTAAIGERYGVRPPTVARWVTAGCPCIRLPGGRYRFDAAAVERWRAAIERAGRRPELDPTPEDEEPDDEEPDDDDAAAVAAREGHR